MEPHTDDEPVTMPRICLRTRFAGAGLLHDLLAMSASATAVAEVFAANDCQNLGHGVVDPAKAVHSEGIALLEADPVYEETKWHCPRAPATCPDDRVAVQNWDRLASDVRKESLPPRRNLQEILQDLGRQPHWEHRFLDVACRVVPKGDLEIIQLLFERVLPIDPLNLVCDIRSTSLRNGVDDRTAIGASAPNGPAKPAKRAARDRPFCK